MVIRLAQSTDITAIQNCAVASYKKYVERIGKNPAPMVADFKKQVEARIVRVATNEDDELEGFIVFFPKDDLMFLENVAVSPNHQGKGVGNRLIAFCEDEAKRLDLQAVELYTNEKMTENLTLYPRLGFEEIGRRKEDGFNRVFFRKQL